MKNTKNIKKPMPKKAKRVLSIWISIVMMITMMTLCTVTCFAAEDDPITVVNNLSDFMFGLVRAVGMIMLGFAVVLCRLFWLCSNTAYAARAEAQSTATLTFPARRGNFYDCNGHLLTGLGEQWLALSLPGEGSYTKLYPYASKAGQAMLYQKRNASRPFLVEVTRDVSAMGAWCYAVPRRYGDAPLASALLGYLDGEGHGVAGLEAVLEDLLSGTGAQDKLVCAVNAQGKLRSGTEPELVKSDSGAVGV